MLIAQLSLRRSESLLARHKALHALLTATYERERAAMEKAKGVRESLREDQQGLERALASRQRLQEAVERLTEEKRKVR